MINSISKYAFTLTEQKSIKELLKYCEGKNVESARILKNDTDITDKFIIDENNFRVNMHPKGEVLPCHEAHCPIFELVKKKMLLKDSTYIHFHPKTLPLSFGDVLSAFLFKMKKIVAVTSDGKYSIFAPNPSVNVPKEELFKQNKKIREIINKNGIGYILDNPVHFEKYKTYMQLYWQKLAAQNKSQYMSNM